MGTTIDGKTGWRLPTQYELNALKTSGAMNGQGWKLYYTWSSASSSDDYYYSSDLSTTSASSAESVAGSHNRLVTCVHPISSTAETAQPATPQVELPKGYVSQGGLTWMPINTSTKNWADANAFCNNATINGQTGWRLPTKDELIALNDSGAMNGQDWSLSAIWSSTPGNLYGHYFFWHGGTVNSVVDFDITHRYVTCVR